MEARRELTEAVRERYRSAGRPRRSRFLTSSRRSPDITGSTLFGF
jgi:hypothetical protein